MTSTIQPTCATRANLLTSGAPSAIAVIELSGAEAISNLQRFWRPASSMPLKLNRIRYGVWDGGGEVARENDAETRAVEDVVVCLTASDRIEIHCHGGQIAAKRILDDLQGAGVFIAMVQVSSWQTPSCKDDFLMQLETWEHRTWDAFLKSRTVMATSVLLDQVRGVFSNECKVIQQLIVSGNQQEAKVLVQRLIQRSRIGLPLVDGWRIAIAGPPNAGKSSLMNAILGYDRAIVHESAGTTRDVLEEQSSILGWPVRFIDTAGLRNSDDVVEKIGVERAWDVAANADCILLLIEPNEGWTDLHTRVFQNGKSKTILVGSKSDIKSFSEDMIPLQFRTAAAFCNISSSAGTGLEQLFETIIANWIGDSLQSGDAVPLFDDQVQWLTWMTNSI